MGHQQNISILLTKCQISLLVQTQAIFYSFHLCCQNLSSLRLSSLHSSFLPPLFLLSFFPSFLPFFTPPSYYSFPPFPFLYSFFSTKHQARSILPKYVDVYRVRLALKRPTSDRKGWICMYTIQEGERRDGLSCMHAKCGSGQSLYSKLKNWVYGMVLAELEGGKQARWKGLVEITLVTGSSNLLTNFPMWY